MIPTVLDNPRLVPALILGVSLGALAAALTAQHLGDIQPCVLCIYQRWAYVGAAAFGASGVLLGGMPGGRRLMVALAGLAFLAGAGIAFFHVGVEQQWWRGTAECHAPAFDPNMSIADLRKQMLGTRFVSCDEIPWSLFGLSMAGYNVIASLGLAVAAFWAARRMARTAAG